MGVLMGQYPAPTDAEMLGGHSTFPWYDEYKKGTAFKGKGEAKKPAKKTAKKTAKKKATKKKPVAKKTTKKRGQSK